MKVFKYSLFLISIILFSGCVPLFEKMAKKASKDKIERTFNFYVNKAPEFKKCMNTYGGSCLTIDDPQPIVDTDSPYGDDIAKLEQSSLNIKWYSSGVFIDSQIPAGDDLSSLNLSQKMGKIFAANALNSPFQKKLDFLFNAASGLVPTSDVLGDTISYMDSDEPSEVLINFDLSELEQYQEDIEAATILGGWKSLENGTELVIGDDIETVREKSRRKYIAHYMRAYFRQGHFFKATISSNELKSKVVEQIRSEMPGLEDSDYNDLAGKLFGQLGFGEDGNLLFGKIDSTGFVTRGGQAYQFPGIEASLSLGNSKINTTKVDYVVVGTDLIRVLLHAVYDASHGLPALSNSTGANWPEGLEDYKLSVHDPENPDSLPTWVDVQEFDLIETRSAQVEGVTSAAVGRLIRGISVISLNNEAIATAIETAVGVALRKQTERLLWCFYSCGLNEPPSNGLGDVTNVEEKEIKITLRFNGFQPGLTE